MRTGDTQSVPTATPNIYLEIQTAVPEDVSSRIIKFHLDEQLYGGVYEFWLNNSDSALAAKSYEGFRVDLQLGFSGGTRSQFPDLWVDTQHFESIEGKLLMKLTCIDAWGLLSKINVAIGAQYWNYPDFEAGTVDGDTVIPAGRYGAGATVAATYNGKTIEQIVTFLIQNALDNTFAIDDDDAETYFNTLTPPLMLTNARQGIFQAMNMTGAYLLYKNDEDFHVIKPSDHASTYTYALGSNQVWQNSQQSTILIPNRFIYHGRTGAGVDLNSTTGDATRGVDATSYSRLGLYIDEHYYGNKTEITLISDQTLLNSLAVATLLKKQGEVSQGTLLAPMHCSQELLDAITITDTRYSGTKTITGYVHRIIRDYEANKGIYSIQLALGGVASAYTPPGGTVPMPKVSTEDDSFFKGQKIKFQTEDGVYDSYIYLSLVGDIVLLPPATGRVYVYQEGLFSPNRMVIPCQ